MRRRAKPQQFKETQGEQRVGIYVADHFKVNSKSLKNTIQECGENDKVSKTPFVSICTNYFDLPFGAAIPASFRVWVGENGCEKTNFPECCADFLSAEAASVAGEKAN